MPARNVMLMFPHPGSVRTEFLYGVIASVYSDESPVSEIRDIGGGPMLSRARNEMARLFLETPNEWLWMVDSDMVFTRNTLPALLAAADPEERPVMGALCFMQRLPEGTLPVMYKAALDDGRPTFETLRDWPPGEPVQVAATGAGCLLIHRNVFKRISENVPDSDGAWFAEYLIGGKSFGEDTSFCIRCAQAKVPVHVHTGVQVGHVKPGMVGEVTP